jgi:hypothetical protein
MFADGDSKKVADGFVGVATRGGVLVGYEGIILYFTSLSRFVLYTGSV